MKLQKAIQRKREIPSNYYKTLPLQNFCLQNPMDRGALWATVHGVTKSWM